MHAAAYHIPNMVTIHGNLRQFSGQGKLLEFLGKKNIATKVLKTRKSCFYKFYFQVWKKNNDDARRILQWKTNHTDDPADILQAEHRICSLKHRERQHRNFKKKTVEYWEDTIKSYWKTRKHLSYDKPKELQPVEEEAVAVEPPPEKTKRGKRKQSANSSKSNTNKKSKCAKKSHC